MNRRFLLVLVGLLIAAGAIHVTTAVDEFIEINSMTGATRVRTCRAFILNTPWRIRSTWAAESAERQEIPTESGWRFLSVVYHRLGFRSRACGRSPASYPLAAIHPEDLDLKTEEEIDTFVHEFIHADEPKRIQMLVIP